MWSTLVNIARLRGSPADLPASANNLYKLVLLDLIVSAVASAQAGQMLLAQTVFALGLHLGLIWLILRQFGKPERFVQTATAWFGVDLLLTLLLLPMLAFIAQYAGVEPVPASAQMMVSLLMVISLWMLLAFGHIFRSALEMPLLVGVLIALSMLIAQLMIVSLIFGGPTLE